MALPPPTVSIAVRDPQTALQSVLHEMACLPDSQLCFPKWLDEAIANPRLGVDPKGIEDLLAKPPKNPTRSPLFYHYRRLVHKVRSHAPFLRSYSVARKLNDAIERITEKLPKQSVSISQRDRNRIAYFFPYPIDERELSKQREPNNATAVSSKQSKLAV